MFAAGEWREISKSVWVCAQPLKSAALCALVLSTMLSSCSSRRVEETVTIDASRYTPTDANVQPIPLTTPHLPARDADIETAGDSVAEAIVRLHKRQSAAALNALSRAESAINRALRREPPHTEQALDVLNTTLKEIEAARHAIQHGAQREALAELGTVNKKIDSLAALENN